MTMVEAQKKQQVPMVVEFNNNSNMNNMGTPSLMPSKGSSICEGSQNMSFLIGDNSSVTVNSSCPSLPSTNGSHTSKTTCQKRPHSDVCLLTLTQDADSGRQGKHKKRKKMNIPNMLYNAMKVSLETMVKADLEKCVRLLSEDSSGFGLEAEELGKVTTVDNLLTAMEKENILSEDNLFMLQYMLRTTGPKNELLCKKVDEYAARRETRPLRLKPIKRKAAKGTSFAEFRINGDAKHLKNITVTEFKQLVSENLGIKKRFINLVAVGNGSVTLVFQMTHSAVENLRQAVAKRKSWLLDGGIIGVHIDGEEYVEILREGNCGYVEVCVDCKHNILREFFSDVRSMRYDSRAVLYRTIQEVESNERATCAGCDCKFNKFDFVIHTGEDLYHTRCFSCVECKKRICPGDEFFKKHDKKIVCLQDFKTTARKRMLNLKLFPQVENDQTHKTPYHAVEGIPEFETTRDTVGKITSIDEHFEPNIQGYQIPISNEVVVQPDSTSILPVSFFSYNKGMRSPDRDSAVGTSSVCSEGSTESSDTIIPPFSNRPFSLSCNLPKWWCNEEVDEKDKSFRKKQKGTYSEKRQMALLKQTVEELTRNNRKLMAQLETLSTEQESPQQFMDTSGSLCNFDKDRFTDLSSGFHSHILYDKPPEADHTYCV